MGNYLGGPIWEIDTAAVTVLAAGWLKVNHFEWYGYTVETHTVVVTDKNGKTVWVGNGDASLNTQASMGIGWIQGLIVSTLGSGKLLVYVD